MSVNALGGPLVVLVLVGASVWFGREVMDGVNRMYRPAVQAWMDKHNQAYTLARTGAYTTKDLEGSCHRDDPECRDSGKSERSCAEEMQERVRILTLTKGLTGPDPGGKYKALLKEEFVANMKAIRIKCQAEREYHLRCSSPHSNLNPYTLIYMNIHQCWCPLINPHVQCYYFDVNVDS